jgi:hypothetical protein
MNKSDIILTLLKYFSQFVKKEVRQGLFIAPDGSRQKGYEELEAEIMSIPEDRVIDDIDLFVVSANEKMVSDKIKNTQHTSLYVEYGSFSYNPSIMQGVREKLAVHVAYPYTIAANDMINENLLMNRMHNNLCSILDQMEKDQNELEFCGNRKLIDFPAEIVAIDPPLFYDRAGWMGIFDSVETNLA